VGIVVIVVLVVLVGSAIHTTGAVRLDGK